MDRTRIVYSVSQSAMKEERIEMNITVVGAVSLSN